MNDRFEASRHVAFRVALALYVAYVLACAWFYAWGIPPGDRQTQDLFRFFIALAAGLPWTLAVLALPSILGDFGAYSAGEGFMTMVHGLSFAAVAMNLVALNYLCEWPRLFGREPRFEATS